MRAMPFALMFAVACSGGGDSFTPSSDVAASHPWLISSGWSGVMQDGTPGGNPFSIGFKATALWLDPGEALGVVYYPAPTRFGEFAVRVGGAVIRGDIVTPGEQIPFSATIAPDRGSMTGTAGQATFQLLRDAGFPRSTREVWVIEYR